MKTQATGRQPKATIIGQWAQPFRVCEFCKEEKPAQDFVRYRGRHSNRICKGCWHTRREEVLDFLLGKGAPTAEHRKVKNRFLEALAARRFSKRGEINGMSTNEYAVKAAKLPDRIAAVIGKTYAEQGDAATLADDEALMMIRDLLIELDETLIPRNKNKRLSRR